VHAVTGMLAEGFKVTATADSGTLAQVPCRYNPMSPPEVIASEMIRTSSIMPLNGRSGLRTRPMRKGAAHVSSTGTPVNVPTWTPLRNKDIALLVESQMTPMWFH